MTTTAKTVLTLSGEFYTIIRDGGLIRDGGGYALYTSSKHDDHDGEIKPASGRGLFKTKARAVKAAHKAADVRLAARLAARDASLRAILA